MRSTPAVLVLCGALVAGHVTGVLRDEPVLARGAGAVALAVLAAWAFAATRSWPLVAGLGVLAVATGAGYAWDVPRTRSTEISWFAYAPLPAPDLAYFRWTGAATLLGYAPDRLRRGAAAAPAVADGGGRGGGADQPAHGGLRNAERLGGPHPSFFAAAEAFPSLLAAATVLAAWVLSARRTGFDALLVWAGLGLLAIPALRGAVLTADVAAFAERLRATFGAVGDLNSVSSASNLVVSYAGWTHFALGAFFAGLRPLGAAIVVLGVIRCVPPSTDSVPAEPVEES